VIIPLKFLMLVVGRGDWGVAYRISVKKCGLKLSYVTQLI